MITEPPKRIIGKATHKNSGENYFFEWNNWLLLSSRLLAFYLTLTVNNTKTEM